jgi:integrase
VAASEPIRNRKQVKQMANYWRRLGNGRNYLLIVLGVNTALRSGDFLGLRWSDVFDFESDSFRSHIALTEKKIGKEKVIAINERLLKALRLCMKERRVDYIFANNRKDIKPIYRSQAWRIIKAAAVAVKAVGRISCHSLRKTFGYFAWKAGVQPVMLMDIFNHSSFEITKRYLGATQRDVEGDYYRIEPLAKPLEFCEMTIFRG